MLVRMFASVNVAVGVNMWLSVCLSVCVDHISVTL